MFKLFVVVLSWFIVAIPPGFAESKEGTSEVLRVAVLSFRGSEQARYRWDPTMSYLSLKIPDKKFEAVPMDLEQLDRAVVNGKVDFVITNSGQYVRVGTKFGLSWLATLKSKQHPGVENVIGSALVVRAESEYQSLEDLQDKLLGAVSPMAFGGFQIFWGELADRGWYPDRFFSNIRFSGFPVDALAYWVRDGLVDAVVLPACLLENMAEQGLLSVGDYRVLNTKHVPDYNCQTSTQLYPNWSFSKTKSTPTELAEQVAKALLELPQDSLASQRANSLGWTTPVSSFEIHQLYQKLDIHPWQSPWWQSLLYWLKNNWLWGLLALAVALVGFIHHLWVQMQVTRRTRELKLAHSEARLQQQQLEHAQRVAILGELSSDLAHELNQPLAAINSYAEGGMVRIEQHQDPHDISGLLKRIAQESYRGAEIIQRIRRFVRNDQVIRSPLNMNQLIQETLDFLDYELDKIPVTIELDLPEPPLYLPADPIELQQLLVNLIHNALDAMAESPKRILEIALFERNGSTVIKLSDSGHGIEDSIVSEIFKPFISTKPEGMGLGMSICKRIMDAHDGTITVGPSLMGGTLVTCEFSGAADD